MKVLFIFFSFKFILFLKRKTIRELFNKKKIWYIYGFGFGFLITMDTNRPFIARFKTVIRIKKSMLFIVQLVKQYYLSFCY